MKNESNTYNMDTLRLDKNATKKIDFKNERILENLVG